MSFEASFQRRDRVDLRYLHTFKRRRSHIATMTRSADMLGHRQLRQEKGFGSDQDDFGSNRHVADEIADSILDLADAHTETDLEMPSGMS